MVETDYSSYAVVYNCKSVFQGFLKQEYAWFLSRTPTASSDLLSKVTEIVSKKLPRYN